MSRYPSATWKPIRDTSTARVTKDILCFHTAVGAGLSTWSYFDRLDVGVYSHGVICGIWGSDAGKDVDGEALQMADTEFRAAANLDGNWRVISWETADNAVRPIAPWTPKQCDTIVGIIVDAHSLDGIPLALIPDSKPGRRGIAYHRLGCDPYRATDGELWSSAYGKDCPTDPRIAQLPALIERARAVVAGQPEGPLMALTDAEQQEILTRVRHIDSAGIPALGRIDALLPKVMTVLQSAGVDSAKRDAAVLAVLTAIQAEPGTDVDALAAALAPKLAELGVNLDVDTIVKAIRADLASALAEPAA